MKGSMINNGEENGGNQGVPAVAPTVSILPKFNSMAVFTVQPGRSYHSVQVLSYAPTARTVSTVFIGCLQF